MSSKKPAASRAAIKERGEHQIVLGGITYLLRPSYAAQVAIESKTRPYMSLAAAAQFGQLRIEEAQVAVAEFINAGAGDDPMKRVDAGRIGEMVYEQGLPHVAAILANVFTDALSGGRTALGEAKAAPVKA